MDYLPYVENRIAHLISWANNKYRVNLQIPTVSFSLERKKLSGQSENTLLFNSRRLEENPNSYLQNQVTRETLLWISGKSHFTPQQVFSDFGLVNIPKVVIPQISVKRSKYAYSCGCGFLAEIGNTKHEKVQLGNKLPCKLCGNAMAFLMELEND
jgi:predicted SprT family Zn-dependent metalloprotease